MGRIVSSFFISLDGVVEAPDTWHMSYFNDEMGAVVGAGMETNKAFIMGRRMYDEWSAYWPTSTDEPYASYFNNIPKYVVSGSLQDPTWTNTTVVPPRRRRGAPREGERRRRHRHGRQRDHGALATGQRPARRAAPPGAPGRRRQGQRLFEDTPTHPLELVESSTFQTGVLNLLYRAAS